MIIKIIDVPVGDTPYWVRKESVGLVLAAEDDQQTRKVLLALNADEKTLKSNLYFAVPMPEVLRAVREKNMDIALLWLTEQVAQGADFLLIERKVCAIIL